MGEEARTPGAIIALNESSDVWVCAEDGTAAACPSFSWIAISSTMDLVSPNRRNCWRVMISSSRSMMTRSSTLPAASWRPHQETTEQTPNLLIVHNYSVQLKVLCLLTETPRARAENNIQALLIYKLIHKANFSAMQMQSLESQLEKQIEFNNIKSKQREYWGSVI